MNIARDGIREKSRRGRKRVYPTAAARTQAWRDRQQPQRQVFDAFRQEIRDAIARGRGSWSLEHGPDEPTAWLGWATERLEAVRLVPYPRAAGEGRKLSRAAVEALTGLLVAPAVEHEGRVTVGGKAVPPATWKMLTERGYVVDGQVTEAGREALLKSQQDTQSPRNQKGSQTSIIRSVEGTTRGDTQ